LAIPNCSALWIGTELGPLNAACLRSFGDVGMPLTLYVYDRPQDAPPNVELADANLIVPRDRIFRHAHRGSYAVFADLFRYRLLEERSTLWVDTDVYCVRPIRDEEMICGWEDGVLVNNAVLKLPAGSPVLRKMINVTTNPFFVAPWISRTEGLRAVAKHFIKGGPTASHMLWGVTGPSALTYYLKQAGLDHLARPPAEFYPVHWTQTEKFLSPGVRVHDLIDPSTSCIHLYNEMLRKADWLSAPADSPIKEMLEGRVEC
jgi:mannosyltransferase OCH1-like enzyme